MDYQEKMPLGERDLSWLAFNYRVLQEAKDPNVPLLERLKFLAIYSSNLDEFFRIRVANARNLKRVGKQTRSQLGFDPKELLMKIHMEVNIQQEEFSYIFESNIIPELKKHRIYLKRRLELNKRQQTFAKNYFDDNLLPYVMPVLLVKKRIKAFLANANIYLVVHLQAKKEVNPKDEYAIVRIPSDSFPRFVKLPSPKGEHHIIMLDDIVRHSLSRLLPGYEIMDSYSIKQTRDAELYIDDESEGDLVEKIRSSLAKRQVGPPSRFVYDREMPKEVLDFLIEEFSLGRYDRLPEGRYHNNFDFFGFPDFGYSHLKNEPFPPLDHPVLSKAGSIFEAMEKKDQIIHVPFQKYDPVVRFFDEAADDPTVTHIKIVQYRVSKKSKIMEALIRAVNAGKEVSVFVEIKARFDEAANLAWAEKLKDAGVKVHYSIPKVKVHCKLALIHRKIEGKVKYYCYLSSGNFHEDTAKIYGDWGLFTFNRTLAREVSHVFAYLEKDGHASPKFKHLLVGQFNLRSGFYEAIEREMAIAYAGRHAEIIVKVNSLQDKEIIEKLYLASEAGVKIRLIVRGICCLQPNVEGYSTNIEAFSIVDRFLEHARVMIFHNDGKNDVYVSSADWMTRNLTFRVETAFPIYDEDIKKEIMDIIQIQLSDNVKARNLDPKKLNHYKDNDRSEKIRSQETTYRYYQKLLEESRKGEEKA